MKTLNTFFTYLSWGVWLVVVLLNVLGVTQVPWNVAIVPMVITGVFSLCLIFITFSKKEEIEKIAKEYIDKKIKEEEQNV